MLIAITMTIIMLSVVALPLPTMVSYTRKKVYEMDHRGLRALENIEQVCVYSSLKWKTCFQNKSKFITEDQFVKHMNITIK